MRLGVEPLDDAVHVEAMGTHTPHNGTIISGKSAFWAAVLKVHPANATVIVVGQPSPGRNSDPVWKKRGSLLDGG